MPKKAKKPKTMKPRQCAKALKSKKKEKVFEGLNDPICSDLNFLSGKLGVIHLLNLLIKQKVISIVLVFRCNLGCRYR